MKISIYAIGKLKAQHWQRAALEYQKRLRHYVDLKVFEIRDARPGKKTAAQIAAEESQAMRDALPDGTYQIVVDRRGTSLSSEALAAFLARETVAGRREIAFCLGGSVGFTDAMLQTADFVLSLSPMTFPHELARVILLEQLYRAFTIIRNEKYHK